MIRCCQAIVVKPFFLIQLRLQTCSEIQTVRDALNILWFSLVFFGIPFIDIIIIIVHLIQQNNKASKNISLLKFSFKADFNHESSLLFYNVYLIA